MAHLSPTPIFSDLSKTHFLSGRFVLGAGLEGQVRCPCRQASMVTDQRERAKEQEG